MTGRAAGPHADGPDATLARIAGYGAGLRFSHLPDAVVHECKRRLVDTVGCALAGFDTEPARIARALALRGETGRGAALLGTSRLVLPELAAFANGVMVRCLDGNDCCPGGGGHPSDAIPAVLAAAEAAGAGGTEVVTAIALAYELHHALFEAARLSARGLDHTLYTAVAVAAAAARLLGLGPERAAHAVSLAATANLALGATRRGQLSMWKGCAGADAARNGLFAALAAEQGLSGPAAPFEGAHGLRDLLGTLPLGALAEPGGAFRILRTDLKSLVAEYHAQGPVTAALSLARGLDLDTVARIEIHTYAFACREIGSGPEKWRPQTRETADHSLPFAVAGALVDGAFSDALFAPARLSDPRILDLADRIRVHEDPAFSARVPDAFPCRVTITTVDGGERTASLPVPRGHHADPMSDAEVSDKFRSLAGRALAPAAVEPALAALWNVEGHARIADLPALLRIA